MDQDESHIREAIEGYVTGFSRADKPLLMQVLHERFISAGFVEGAFQWDSADEFADFCVAAAPDRNGPIPPREIESLSIAVVHDRWGDREFRDTLTLIKDVGGSCSRRSTSLRKPPGPPIRQVQSFTVYAGPAGCAQGRVIA